MSALFLGARMERVACFVSGAHGPLPSLQLSLALSLSLSLLAKSLSGALCSCEARAAAHQGASRRAARSAGNENSGIAAREETQQEAVLSPRGLGPSPQELPLHAPQVTEARIGSLRPRAGVAASASEAAGGEFEGGLEHWSGVAKMHHSVRGRAPQGSAFGCSPGTPPGSLREAPGVLPGAWSSALSALFLGALGARRVLFQRRARSSSLSPALARSLSLLGKSLSGVFCSGAARAAAHQRASRRARHARAMRTAASQLGKRQHDAVLTQGSRSQPGGASVACSSGRDHHGSSHSGACAAS